MIFEEWEFASCARSCGESGFRYTDRSCRMMAFLGETCGVRIILSPSCRSESMSLRIKILIPVFFPSVALAFLYTCLPPYEPYLASVVPRSTCGTAAALVPHGGLFEFPGSPNPACSILVDVGYSYSHVTPIVDGKVVWTGIRR